MRKYELGGVTVQKRSRLPHWHADHANYFDTLRLFDSLPAHVLAQLRAERDAAREQICRLRGNITFPEQRMLDAHRSLRKVSRSKRRGVSSSRSSSCPDRG